MKLTVVGGFYIERCIQPLWDEAFGSGGRAAAAVSAIVPDTVLVTYVPDDTVADAEALAGRFGFKLRREKADNTIAFDYLHPLSTPRITPRPGSVAVNPSIQVVGDVVLRFGMLEGDAIVQAKTAVYDPQSAFGATSFASNGSTADRLAIVLNRAEATAITGTGEPSKAAEWLMREEGAVVVIVKMGSQGAYVATQEKSMTIPVYKSKQVWKLGSGDVFSSAFTAFWGVHGVDPFTAADLASRATAIYCETRSLPISEQHHLEQAQLTPIKPGHGTVYLASPFFDIGQRWLVEEARFLLQDLGASVFSPVHEVGPGPGEIVAPADIKGLEDADVVLAILNGLDTGTVFEVGYAVKKGMPVVALAQNIKNEDLKMVAGMGCEVVDDLTSAIYRVLWRLPEQ